MQRTCIARIQRPRHGTHGGHGVWGWCRLALAIMLLASMAMGKPRNLPRPPGGKGGLDGSFGKTSSGSSTSSSSSSDSSASSAVECPEGEFYDENLEACRPEEFITLRGCVQLTNGSALPNLGILLVCACLGLVLLLQTCIYTVHIVHCTYMHVVCKYTCIQIEVHRAGCTYPVLYTIMQLYCTLSMHVKVYVKLECNCNDVIDLVRLCVHTSALQIQMPGPCFCLQLVFFAEVL